MSNQMKFLIEYSGLQQSTIEQSYKWVIEAMRAFEKHLSHPSAVQAEALRYSHELRENLVKWLTETFCYIYRDEADIIIDHFQRYASLSAPQDEGWVKKEKVINLLNDYADTHWKLTEPSLMVEDLIKQL